MSRVHSLAAANFEQSLAPIENLKTSVVHGAENLFVGGSVEDYPCCLTIDTGSNVSII